MEALSAIIIPLLATRHYEIQDVNGDGESKNSISFTNSSDPADTIAIRIVDIPHCNETIIYVKAKKLFHRIITLKMSKNQGSSSLSTRIGLAIMQALFPPEVSVPTLPHVPDLCIAQICSYLEAKEVVYLGFSCTSLSSSILQNQKLWSDLYGRDFIGQSMISNDTSSAITRYREMFSRMVSLQRLRQSPLPRIGRAYGQAPLRYTYMIPSPLSEFMGSDSDTSSFGALDPFGSFAPFGVPIPRPRFDNRFG